MCNLHGSCLQNENKCHGNKCHSGINCYVAVQCCQISRILFGAWEDSISQYTVFWRCTRNRDVGFKIVITNINKINNIVQFHTAENPFAGCNLRFIGKWKVTDLSGSADQKSKNLRCSCIYMCISILYFHLLRWQLAMLVRDFCKDRRWGAVLPFSLTLGSAGLLLPCSEVAKCALPRFGNGIASTRLATVNKLGMDICTHKFS